MVIPVPRKVPRARGEKQHVYGDLGAWPVHARQSRAPLVPNGSDRGQFVVAALLGVATPPGLSGLSVVETQGARVDLEGLE